MKYGLAFYDEFSGSLAAEEMPVRFVAASGTLQDREDAVREAKIYAEHSWDEATTDMGAEYASDLEWSGPIGTATYRIGYMPRTTFTVRYVVTAP